ncbi:hypothetical protein GWI33_009796 [Rhynchophorus ferrugineus]|uniref:Uncharacterized protein n=1 Tax=Rhynchophorus ferrugineus TaxID=354439 RepID=A0A834IR58_RHYFE|nr:hypothetical protein GWI33_009796 [Rhynchophorus ferrugineus]
MGQRQVTKLIDRVKTGETDNENDERKISIVIEANSESDVAKSSNQHLKKLFLHYQVNNGSRNQLQTKIGVILHLINSIIDVASIYSSASPRNNANPNDEIIECTTANANTNFNINTTDFNTNSTQASSKKARVPPIILRDKHAYMELIRILTFQGVQFGFTQTKPEGVAFYPPIPDDYQMMIDILNYCKYGYNTFCQTEKRHQPSAPTAVNYTLQSIRDVDAAQFQDPINQKTNTSPTYVWRTQEKGRLAAISAAPQNITTIGEILS